MKTLGLIDGPPRAGSDSRAASALIVVLWVIGLLSMFVMAFAFDMHIESRIASAWRKKLKAEYLAQAGIELARMALLHMTDPELKDIVLSDYLAEGSEPELRAAIVSLAGGGAAEFSRDLGDGRIWVSITPVNSRMNINSMIHIGDRQLTYEMWDPLLDVAGVSLEQRDSLVDCLLDWVDDNEFTNLRGAESEYYHSLDPPYSAKNGMFDTVEELILVKGFAEPVSEDGATVYQMVAPFLTAYSEDQMININSASADTLMAFFSMDLSIAQSIVSERLGPDEAEGTQDDEPFKDINDLLTRVPVLDESIKDYVAFSAMGRFSVIARGLVDDVERSVFCVVSLKDKDLTVLNWVQGELPENR